MIKLSFVSFHTNKWGYKGIPALLKLYVRFIKTRLTFKSLFYWKTSPRSALTNLICIQLNMMHQDVSLQIDNSLRWMMWLAVARPVTRYNCLSFWHKSNANVQMICILLWQKAACCPFKICKFQILCAFLNIMEKNDLVLLQKQRQMNEISVWQSERMNKCPLLPPCSGTHAGRIASVIIAAPFSCLQGKDETIIKIFKMRPIHFLPSVIWVCYDRALVRLLSIRRRSPDAKEIHTGISWQYRTVLFTHNPLLHCFLRSFSFLTYTWHYTCNVLFSRTQCI